MPVGAPLDTASVGVKTFTVTANDIAGNQTSRSVTYRVSYRVCAGYDQSVAHHRGSTIPLKVRLCDASGGNVSSPAIVLTATGLAKQDDLSSSVVVEDSGNANPDNNFRYDENLLGYIYNLSTRDLSGGTWVLSFTVSDDPTLHSVQFDIK